MKKAMILAAGRGSRLKPLTTTTPKPLLDLNGRPIIEYTLDLLKRHGFSQVVVNAHYLSGVVLEYFRERPKDSLEIQISLEQNLLGSAGGVKKMENFLDEPFLVMCGDLITGIDLSALRDYHYEKNGVLTVAVTEVDDPRRYGVVWADESGQITRFVEKPHSVENISSREINMGIYIVDPSVMAVIPKWVYFDFGRDLFPLLLEMGAPMFSFKSDSYWRDLGTLDDLARERERFESLKSSP